MRHVPQQPPHPAVLGGLLESPPGFSPVAEGQYEIMKTTAMTRLMKSMRVILVRFGHRAKQAASSRAAFTLFRPSRRGNRAAFGNQFE